MNPVGMAVLTAATLLFVAYMVGFEFGRDAERDSRAARQQALEGLRIRLAVGDYYRTTFGPAWSDTLRARGLHLNEHWIETGELKP